MDPRVQTSFIPKKPLNTGGVPIQRPINLFLVISGVLFVASLSLTGFAYFYNKQLVAKKAELDAELVRRQKELRPNDVAYLRRLDQRLSMAAEVISKHAAFSNIFTFLEEATSQNVRFNKMSVVSSPTESKMTLSGSARSINSVAYQSDIFRGEKASINPIFKGLKLNEKGTFSFSVDMSIDPKLVLYSSNFADTIDVKKVEQKQAPVMTP
jgi:hypothetical protein